jgi:hypothetical protein
MNRKLRLSCSTLALAALLPLAASAQTSNVELECQLHFNLSGWSAFYKTASGTGTVSCNNGQKMAVALNAKGGGLTFGKSEITDGIGKFTGIFDIREVLGAYVNAEAHAGATKSAKAEVMTKGTVSLALSGKGRGWDLGVAFGKFEISKR